MNSITHSSFQYWSCPACVHAKSVNVEQMTNHCRRIDEGESPVDGTAWEYSDKDICPGFEAEKKTVNW